MQVPTGASCLNAAASALVPVSEGGGCCAASSSCARAPCASVGTVPEANRPSLSGGLSPDVTTLMVRNLPHEVLQNDVLRELERCGLLEACDFLYLPSSFGTRRSKGYAFVNFSTPEAADLFYSTWHKSRRFEVPANISLNVSAAVIQGRCANVQRWDSAKMRRVKNANYRPYIPSVPGELEAIPNHSQQRQQQQQQHQQQQQQQQLPAQLEEGLGDYPRHVQVGQSALVNLPDNSQQPLERQAGRRRKVAEPMPSASPMPIQQQPSHLSAPISPPALPPMPYEGGYGGGGLSAPMPGAPPMLGARHVGGPPFGAASALPGSSSLPGGPLPAGMPPQGGQGHHRMMPSAHAAPPPPAHAPGGYGGSLGYGAGPGSHAADYPLPPSMAAPIHGADFLINRWVQVVDLIDGPQFNGRWAVVEAFDPLTTRFTVRVLMGNSGAARGPGGNEQWLQIRIPRENIDVRNTLY